jgi:hypothetical protein
LNNKINDKTTRSSARHEMKKTKVLNKILSWKMYGTQDSRGKVSNTFLSATM